MKFFVYVIQSLVDGSFYTGQTNNLIRRLTEHDQGKISTPTTLHKGPFRLVHAEQHLDRDEARRREIFWKSGYGRELRDRIVKQLIIR